MVRASLDGVRTVHQVHSPEIEVAGDEARAIWAMQDRLVWPDGRTLTGFGHYHERYRRVDGTWRIAEGRLTRLLRQVKKMEKTGIQIGMMCAWSSHPRLYEM